MKEKKKKKKKNSSNFSLQSLLMNMKKISLYHTSLSSTFYYLTPSFFLSSSLYLFHLLSRYVFFFSLSANSDPHTPINATHSHHAHGTVTPTHPRTLSLLSPTYICSNISFFPHPLFHFSVCCGICESTSATQEEKEWNRNCRTFMPFYCTIPIKVNSIVITTKIQLNTSLQARTQHICTHTQIHTQTHIYAHDMREEREARRKVLQMKGHRRSSRRDLNVRDGQERHKFRQRESKIHEQNVKRQR